MLSVPTWAWAMVSGGLLGLAAAPVGGWPLAWCGLIPLFWVAGNFRLGWLAGTVYYLILLLWLWGLHPLTWLGIEFWPSLGIAGGSWLLVSVLAGLSFGLWTWSLGFFNGQPAWLRGLASLASWLLLEKIWGSGPLAFPWGTLAATQSNSWFLPVVQLGGASLLVALLVLVNFLLSEKAWWQAGGLLLIAGLWRGLPIQPGTAFKVGVIQGNISQTQRGRFSPERVMAIYTEGYRYLARQQAQIILTPETALTVIWDNRAQTSPLAQAVRAVGVPLLLGAWGQREGQYTNTLFSLGTDGTILGSFDKIHLVPLGETIPFKDLLGGLIAAFSPIHEDLAPGTADQPLATPLTPVGVSICYDSAFGEELRLQTLQGAQWLVTSTNDAWFGPQMPAQRQALETLRAVENGRWLVRASNTGSSGAIDPQGRTLFLSRRGEYGTFVVPVTPQTQLTPYTRWGEVWLWGLWGLWGLSILGYVKGTQDAKLGKS